MCCEYEMAFTTVHVKMYKQEYRQNMQMYYIPCSGLLEDIGVNVHHEITTTSILHLNEDMGLGLEAAAQVDQERVLHCIDSLKNPFL